MQQSRVISATGSYEEVVFWEVKSEYWNGLGGKCSKQRRTTSRPGNSDMNACTCTDRRHWQFFKALNGVYRVKGFTNDMVIIHLIQSYGKLLLLYASECFNMTRSETSQLCRARRCVYWKVFKVRTDEAIDLIQVSTGLSALDIELRHQRSSFVHKLSCSTNSIINGLFALKLWTGWCFCFFPFFLLFSCVLSLYCFLSIFVCLSVCYACGE